ncbi:hypothetical protein ES708_07582 [subsurface metagenome]
MTVIFTAVHILSLSAAKLILRYPRARTILRKAPMAAASVGVIMPPKITPNTRTIMARKGSISTIAPSFSLKGVLGGFGARLGLSDTITITVSASSNVSIIPGTKAAAKSRATETSCHPP